MDKGISSILNKFIDLDKEDPSRYAYADEELPIRENTRRAVAGRIEKEGILPDEITSIRAWYCGEVSSRSAYEVILNDGRSFFVEADYEKRYPPSGTPKTMIGWKTDKGWIGTDRLNARECIERCSSGHPQKGKGR